MSFIEILKERMPIVVSVINQVNRLRFIGLDRVLIVAFILFNICIKKNLDEINYVIFICQYYRILCKIDPKYKK